MYIAVRHYEGVKDPQKVRQVVKEGFVPLISEMPGFAHQRNARIRSSAKCQDSWLSTGSTPVTA
jgi:hypothetical protein